VFHGAIETSLRLTALASALQEDLIHRDGVTKLVLSRRTSAVFTSGTPATHVYFLESGLVKIEKITESGKDILLGVVASGELFGEQGLLGEGVFPVSAKVMDAGIAYAIPTQLFQSFCEGRSDLWRLVVKHLLTKKGNVERKIEHLCMSDVKERIVYYLDDLAKLAVVDPHEALVDRYLAEAERVGAPIAAIFETHVQADHVSGLPALVEATGATAYLPDGAPVEFAHEALADGAMIALGNTHVRALATPGHAPAHNAYIGSDLRRGTDEAWFVFTGDSLLVGDVGRPDLHAGGDPEPLARRMFESVSRLLELPDGVLVLPSHYAGSVCGRSLSGNPFSTIGFERRHNRALQFDSEEAFVEALVRDIPPAPVNQAAIVIGYWWAGLLTADVWRHAAVFFVPATLGLLLGMALFARVNHARFRRIVFAILFASGLLLVVRG